MKRGRCFSKLVFMMLKSSFTDLPSVLYGTFSILMFKLINYLLRNGGITGQIWMDTIRGKILQMVPVNDLCCFDDNRPRDFMSNLIYINIPFWQHFICYR